MARLTREEQLRQLRQSVGLAPIERAPKREHLDYAVLVRPAVVANTLLRENYSHSEDFFFRSVHLGTECWAFIALDRLRSRRPESRTHAQGSYDALFAPADTAHASLAECAAVAEAFQRRMPDSMQGATDYVCDWTANNRIVVSRSGERDALRDALWHNSLTIAKALGKDTDSMFVEVTIGVPRPDEVDKAEILAVLPHGTGEVKCVQGGLEIPNDEGSDATIVAHAAAVVKLDLP